MFVLSVDLVFELLHFVVGALAFDIVVLLFLLLIPVVVITGVIVSCSSALVKRRRCACLSC